MKKLSFVILASLVMSVQAAELYCMADNTEMKCRDLYEVFMAEKVCFSGDVSDVTSFKNLGLKTTRGIKFLEGQVTNENRMLIFVQESGVEQLRSIERCL